MSTEKNNKPEFLFKKKNYKILIIGLVTIALGFLLMSGGENVDPKVFNESVFSFTKIRLAPTIVLIGFGICIYSILKTPKEDKE